MTVVDEKLPMRYRALLAARKYALTARSNLDPSTIPSSIKPNTVLGEILQNIRRFHLQKRTPDAELLAELRDAAT